MMTVEYDLEVIQIMRPIVIRMTVVIVLIVRVLELIVVWLRVGMQIWIVMVIAVYPMVRPILMIVVYVLGVIQDI